MRIIAGKAKGHRIYAPKGLNTRPTTDRVRESLFNILQPIINGTEVLDLFAGTGALGIEALSRGAKHVDFVDCWLPAIKAIKRNLSLTKLESYASVFQEDSLNFIKKVGKKYDLIFLDPPYQTDLAIQALNLLHTVLQDDGIIVVETSKLIEIPEQVGKFCTYRQSVYGDTRIWFYKLNSPN